MTARQHAEIERRAHALRRQELGHLLEELGRLAGGAYATLLRRTVTSTCMPRKSPGAPNHEPLRGAA